MHVECNCTWSFLLRSAVISFTKKIKKLSEDSRHRRTPYPIIWLHSCVIKILYNVMSMIPGGCDFVSLRLFYGVHFM